MLRAWSISKSLLCYWSFAFRIWISLSRSSTMFLSLRSYSSYKFMFDRCDLFRAST